MLVVGRHLPVGQSERPVFAQRMMWHVEMSVDTRADNLAHDNHIFNRRQSNPKQIMLFVRRSPFRGPTEINWNSQRLSGV